MADNRKYYYLKLKESFFDGDSIVLLESMPDGILFSNILMKLYLKSLKNGGKLQLDEHIPYTAQMIATLTRHQIGTVERALEIFLQLGLVEQLDSGAFYMTDIELMIGQSSTEAERKRAARLENKALLPPRTKGGHLSDIRPPEIELLWELHEEHKEDVIKRLEQTYGATDDKKLFEERLMEIAERIAADYYEELLPDLQYMIEDSFLEGLDEQNVGIRLRETLSDSISFTLLSACGADMQEYGSEFAFDFIHEFNSMDTLAVLGDAANELAKPVLLEIGRTIRAYNRSHEQEQTENLTQKGLANTSEIDYNALKRESESGHEEYIDNNQNSVERGNSNESDIREEWGLSDPDITGGQSAGGNRNEVRNDEGDLSEGEPQGRVLSVSSERDIERTPADHSEAGRGENGEADKPDGGNRGSDRTAQGSRSDALGSEDEQHSEPSRGSGSGRTGLQSVTDTDDLLRGDAAEPTFTQLSLFPSFEEQVGTVAAAEASMKYTIVWITRERK